MTLLDLCLLIALGGFVLAGFWFGIVHMVGAFVGMFLGIWAAGHFQGAMADWLIANFAWNSGVAHIFSVMFIYALVARLAGVALWIVEKIFGFFTVIPFLKTFDRLLGAALGFVEGMFAVGLFVYFAGRFPWNDAFAAALAASVYAPKFLATGAVIAPLLPTAIQALKSVI